MVAEVSEAAVVVVLEGEAVSVVEVAADLEAVAVVVSADEEVEDLVVLLGSAVVDEAVANPHLQILVRISFVNLSHKVIIYVA